MGHVFAVVNQKGGVGKTTTATNLAACLALAGQKTLLLDLDPQGNATSGLGALLNEATSPAVSLADVLLSSQPAESVIRTTDVENLFLLPSSSDLSSAEIDLIDVPDREKALLRALSPLRDEFDWILIDAPPSLGLLTVNALVAADSAMVPVQCEYYALEGVSQLLRTIEKVRERANPSLQTGPIILTMLDNRLLLNRQVAEEVRRVFGDRVARRVIPRSVRLAEAPSHGLPAVIYDKRSKGSAAYREIANEVIRNGQKRAGQGS